MEETKEVLEQEVVTETTTNENVGEVQANKEELGIIKSLLSKLLPDKEETNNEDVKKDNETSSEDIDAKVNELAEQKAKDILKEALPKMKKQKEQELLEKEQKQVLNEQLNKVEDNYKEFIKFKMNEESFDLDKFLKENPMYAKKVANNQTFVASNVSSLTASEAVELKSLFGE